MGKKVLFLDSVLKEDGTYSNQYGVDDINAIVSNLTGAGIAPFPSGDTYDVSELNTLTQALVAEGTSLDGLKVNFADNKIHIAQGIGFFENGATIVVDSDGEELDYNVAETLYVYAEYNQALNTCGFYTSESEPISSTGIYVLLLATIAANGTVTDKRKFAQSKVATLGRNIIKTFNVSNSEDNEEYFENETILEVEMDLSKFNIMVLNGYHYNQYDYPIHEIISIDEIMASGGDSFRVYYGGSPANNHYSAIDCKYADGKLQLYVPDYGANRTYFHLVAPYLKVYFC